MTTATQTEYTFNDLLAVSDADGRVYELVRDQLVFHENDVITGDSVLP